MAVYLDVERPTVEGESRTEETWAWWDGAETTRVSTKQNLAKDSLVTKGVSRPPNFTNSTQNTTLSATKPNVHSPLKTFLNTTTKYAERQQGIHQPQISVL